LSHRHASSAIDIRKKEKKNKQLKLLHCQTARQAIMLLSYRTVRQVIVLWSHQGIMP
jgi:hypothetical protein